MAMYGLTYSLYHPREVMSLDVCSCRLLTLPIVHILIGSQIHIAAVLDGSVVKVSVSDT